MTLRFAFVLAAGLFAFSGAALATDCPRVDPLQGRPPYTATTTVSGPTLSAMACGRSDCATAIVAGVTGHPVDARTAAMFAEPTTTYARWTGTQLLAGDGEHWRTLPALPSHISNPNPPSSAVSVVCRAGGEVELNGQAATIYTTHAEAMGMVLDATTWVAKANGLPLKSIQHIKGGRVSVTTFDYGATR